MDRNKYVKMLGGRQIKRSIAWGNSIKLGFIFNMLNSNKNQSQSHYSIMWSTLTVSVRAPILC